MGIFSYLDVIEHLPRRYESFIYTDPDKLIRLADKERAVIYGKLITEPKVLRFRNVSNTTFMFRDAYNHDYKCVAWNRPYLGKSLNTTDPFTLQVSYDAKKHEMNVLGLKKGRVGEEQALVPVYSLPSDYPQHLFASLVKKSFREVGDIYNHVPHELMKKYRLASRGDALYKCHFPTSLEDVRQGLRVLKYEEALIFSLKNQLIRKENKALTSRGKGYIDRGKFERYLSSLPYELTNSQRKAIDESLFDMEGDSLMYRLLQGDVGSGKTLVAASLLYANYLRGSQGAIMAPTETLAEQHYETLKGLFEGTKVQLALLKGKMDAGDRRRNLNDIEDGTADIIVGTHALFSKSVHYAKLGLAIIDEQHKFGVNQRTTLASKGEFADVLLMSATPIPRTLSLTIYGDLDVSTLTEFPSKKRDIQTKIIKPDAKEAQKAIEASLNSNHRIYVVAPKIDEGEEDEKEKSVLSLFEEYNGAYPGKVALLHGRMNEEEKQAAILAFKTGLCPILVSTSVIEVGVDVKNADLMLIYHPTNFALSSLHQLRGRIGRDGAPSKCYLLYEGGDEEELDKLNVLVNSEDGFKIAEEDLRRRGPGELLGVKQSGLPDFHFVNIVHDFRMFECARDDAAYILSHEQEYPFQYILKLAKDSINQSALK
ncbi:MAG: ATP-dependent DNA helicase RecG [Bacilli bacterium]|nr:ATP-dependent DNA helicase RecG [Bacilli bacterium]